MHAMINSRIIRHLGSCEIFLEHARSTLYPEIGWLPSKEIECRSPVGYVRFRLIILLIWNGGSVAGIGNGECSCKRNDLKWIFKIRSYFFSEGFPSRTHSGASDTKITLPDFVRRLIWWLSIYEMFILLLIEQWIAISFFYPSASLS